MNLVSQYKKILESKSGVYTAPGTGYMARVISKNNKHVAKIFKDGVHMQSSDYEGRDEKDAHEFAKEEMEFRTKEKSQVNERISEPEGSHHESGNPIEDESSHQGRKHKQMGRQGNVEALKIIAELLAGKK